MKDDINTIPIPWQLKKYDNELFMTLDTNEFYKIIIPTGYYITNDNLNKIYQLSSDEKNITSIIKWKKKHPKIPMTLLYHFLCFAGEIYNRYKSECAAAIFYDSKDNTYELLFPQQYISNASVTYDPTEGFDEDLSNKIQLVDLHSHHTMSIGFSTTDDNSDNLLGALGSISLIVKNINKFNWCDFNNNIAMRFTIQGRSYDLDVEDVFSSQIDDRFISRVNLRDNNISNFNNFYSDDADIIPDNDIYFYNDINDYYESLSKGEVTDG